MRFIMTALFASALAACAKPHAAPPEVEISRDATALRVQGQLTSDGVECPTLRADNGAVYSLLGDLKGFKAGDYVIVAGTPVGISFCMQGTALRVTQISRKPAGG